MDKLLISITTELSPWATILESCKTLFFLQNIISHTTTNTSNIELKIKISKHVAFKWL